MADSTSTRLNTSVLDRILRNLKPKAKDVCVDAANEIADDVRAHWSGHYPPVSLPEQPPAMRSGRLDTSVAPAPGPTDTSALVVVGAPYGKALEYGTSRMAARPFLRPAVIRMEKKYPGKFKAIVK